MIPAMQRGDPQWSELRAVGVGWWIRNINTLRRMVEKVCSPLLLHTLTWHTFSLLAQISHQLLCKAKCTLCCGPLPRYRTAGGQGCIPAEQRSLGCCYILFGYEEEGCLVGLVQVQTFIVWLVIESQPGYLILCSQVRVTHPCLVLQVSARRKDDPVLQPQLHGGPVAKGGPEERLLAAWQTAFRAVRRLLSAGWLTERRH